MRGSHRTAAALPLKDLLVVTTSVALVLTALLTHTALSETHVVLADPADQQVGEDGVLTWVFQTSARVGENDGDAYGQAYVAVFQFPELGGLAITNANLQAEYEDEGTVDHLTTFAVDLYGLRTNRNSAVLVSDYYEGPYDEDTNAIGLQDDFLIDTAAEGVHHTSDAGDAALAAWLQSLYDDGATTNDYVFLRFSPDANPNSFNRYKLYTADYADDRGPVLTIDTADPPLPLNALMIVVR